MHPSDGSLAQRSSAQLPAAAPCSSSLGVRAWRASRKSRLGAELAELLGDVVIRLPAVFMNHEAMGLLEDGGGSLRAMHSCRPPSSELQR